MSKPSRRRLADRLLVLAVLTCVLVSFNLTSAANPSAVQEPSGGADPNRLWAIVIGVSNYTHAEPLLYAASDAAAFGEFLKSPRGGGIPEDHIFVLLEDEATRFGVLVALEELQGKVQRGDTVYVYIAGHGFIKNRVGYFIPSDGALNLPAATAINFSHLKDMVESGLAHANTRILVTDMCNAGRIGPDQSELGAGIQNLINANLLDLNAGEGTFLNLLASRPTEASWESDELQQGVFTYTLLEALNGRGSPEGQTVASASDVVNYVRTEVASYTASQQNPMANEGFDPQLPLAYLDLPGPDVSATDPRTSLVIVNAGQFGYDRVAWQESLTQAQAMLLLPEGQESIEIAPLETGELELVFRGSEDQERTVRVELESGENTLTLDAARFDFQPAGPVQFAALTPSPPPPAQLAVPVGTSMLFLRLEADTEIYVDDQFFGSSGANERLVELRGLAPGIRNLQLLEGADREYRFRLELFSGPHALDLSSGELRFLAARPPAPSPDNVPPTLPVGSVQTYQDFERALWASDLIEPDGQSAWDYYNQISNLVSADIANDMRVRLVVALGDQAQQTILKYRKGGDIRWSADIFEDASVLTQRVLDLFPTTPELESQRQFFDGRALVENGQYVEAVQTLQEAIDLDPEASHAHNAIGLSFWQQGLLDRAIPSLQQAIALTPEWNYPRYTLSLVYLEQRLYDQAEQGFQAALANDAEDSAAYHGLGQIYLLEGRNDEAETQLQQAVLFNPGNAYAHHTYGQFQQRLGVLDQAEEMFRLAIRIEPEEPAFRASLGALLADNGLVAEAEAVFAEVAATDPNSIPVVQAYRGFLESENRLDEVEDLLERAIERSPEDPNLHVLYGGFLREQGRPDDAEEEYEEAIELDGTNAFAHHDLATLELERQNLDDAERELQLAVEADPRFPAPRRLLGQIRSAQGRFEDALREYEIALEFSVEPEQRQEFESAVAETRTLVVAAMLDNGGEAFNDERYGDAWEVYLDAATVFPEDVDVRNAILRFQYERPLEGETGALPVSELASVLNTEFWRQQTAAESLWRDGRSDEALAMFRAALIDLDSDERIRIAGTQFNLRNDAYGIHEIVYRWAMRMIGERDYAGAEELMARARELNLYAPVPGFSPLTIDSLMYPEDAVDPQVFADFEIAHHPDERAHEIYAILIAVAGSSDEVPTYLETFEGRGPNIRIRMSVAEALSRESLFEEAVPVLEPIVSNEGQVLERESLPSVYVLLAALECSAGDCRAALETLEAGQGLFPDSELIRDAIGRIRQP